MMKAIGIDTLNPIYISWDLVKQQNDSNWEEEFGQRLFLKIFKSTPLSFVLLFKFGTLGEAMYNSTEYLDNAKECASLLDYAVESLGPDMDTFLTEILDAIEDKDFLTRMQPSHYTIIGAALIAALDETLKDEFTKEAKESWSKAFDAISTELINRYGGTKTIATTTTTSSTPSRRPGRCATAA